MTPKKLSDAELKELFLLFIEAANHLEYCSYGDNYERECARDDKLPKRVNSMVIKLSSILEKESK